MLYIIVNMISVSRKTSSSKAENWISVQNCRMLFVQYFFFFLILVFVISLSACVCVASHTLELLFIWDSVHLETAYAHEQITNWNFVFIWLNGNILCESLYRYVQGGKGCWFIFVRTSVRVCHTSKNWEAYLS